MDKITKEYQKLFPEGIAYDEVSEMLEALEKKKEVSDLRVILCNKLIRELSEGPIFYEEMNSIERRE